MHDLADAELLKHYVHDTDESAFAALVQRHLPMVYGASLRCLRNPDAAKEVAQNTFIALAKRAVLLIGHPSLGGWLYRTTIHFAQHHSRSQHRRQHYELLAHHLGTCMKPENSLLTELLPVLDHVMLELRSADREALVLRYFGNRPIREVAAALGIGEDAAQKRIAKALERLTYLFRKRGFRIAAVAFTATVLQEAASNAMPQGLTLAVTQTAIAAGAKSALPFAMPILKFMSLTKIQTAALCLVVAAVPLSYQWRRVTSADRQFQQLNLNIKSLRAQAIDKERERRWAEHRLARLLAEQPSASSATGAQPELSRQNQTKYAWDGNSPYVALPRGILSQVRFAPFATRTARDDKQERYQLPPLTADGSPRPPLEAALGLSDDESQKLRALCQSAFNNFNQLAQQHSTLKEEPFAGAMPSVRLRTEAFPGEGTSFREQFRSQLGAVLGDDRADAFWQQTVPMFDELFNGFGAYVREFQLIKNSNGNIELFNSRPGHSTSIGLLSARNGMPLPPQLQAYADTWTRELQAQPKAQTQQ